MQFRILGPLEVLDGDRPLHLSRRKQRVVLAILLVHANRVVPLDRLVEELWGEQPPPQAIGLLLALACLVATACGRSDGGGGAPAAAPSTTATAGTTTTAGTQACADAAALKASVARLDGLDVPDAGKAGLQAALQDTRTRLEALKGSARSQWGGQVDELDAAVDAFQTTVTGLDSDGLLRDLPTVVRDLERVDQAWTVLEWQIDQTCPKP